jgi:hypothetical protein
MKPTTNLHLVPVLEIHEALLEVCLATWIAYILYKCLLVLALPVEIHDDDCDDKLKEKSE